MNWQTLSTESPYQTAVAIQQELQQGRIAEAEMGRRSPAEGLTWQEVFETPYTLERI